MTQNMKQRAIGWMMTNLHTWLLQEQDPTICLAYLDHMQHLKTLSRTR